MSFIDDLHDQVNNLQENGESGDVNGLIVRVAEAMVNMGHAEATPRLVRDNVIHYLRQQKDWDNYNPIDYIT
jgi:hypothetical protein|tara:strand:+ start:718 stop:933 length:216 start_codon:yes stop_codon:yes gene_type:complete